MYQKECDSLWDITWKNFMKEKYEIMIIIDYNVSYFDKRMLKVKKKTKTKTMYARSSQRKWEEALPGRGSLYWSPSPLLENKSNLQGGKDI